jgi:hypothetical protein
MSVLRHRANIAAFRSWPTARRLDCCISSLVAINSRMTKSRARRLWELLADLHRATWRTTATRACQVGRAYERLNPGSLPRHRNVPQGRHPVPGPALEALSGDRGFESVSLQRQVKCEPDFLVGIVTAVAADVVLLRQPLTAAGRDQWSANVIASVPTPRPTRRVVGSSDREPNSRAGTDGRYNGQTPIPSHVCSSSSIRVAKPSRRQARVGPPLVGGVAERRARHILDRGKPAAARHRDNPAVDRDWDRRADIVVQPPGASRPLGSRQQTWRSRGGAGRRQWAGPTSLKFPLVWLVATADNHPPRRAGG